MYQRRISEIIDSVRGLLCEYNFSSQQHRYFVRLAQHKTLVDSYIKLKPHLGRSEIMREYDRIFTQYREKAIRTFSILHVSMHMGQTMPEDFMWALDNDLYEMCKCFDAVVVQMRGSHANFLL
ncbi:unnamed protein product [Caenorhabditis bovis]|uniref:Uncharacterized protein n=1 Tax=Caenorhabditis bovis TaxID=2654633 RepID=A0A8S1ECU7_9PELO|nr:unnamed protein product [Caenorhabditis bovis]